MRRSNVIGQIFGYLRDAGRALSPTQKWMDMNGASDWRNWALVGLLGMIWGGSFTLTAVAVQDLPPLTITAGRLLIGAAALIPLAFWLGGGFPKSLRVWAFALAAAAAANAMPFILLTWAQTHVPSSLAGVFMASLPLIMLPMAHVWVPGEHMTWPRTAGFFVGFCGVLTLFGWEALQALGGGAIETVAQLACVLAATGYAIGSVVSKRAPPAHPLSFGAATLTLAAAMMLPVAIAVDGTEALRWTPEAAASVVLLGLLPTGAAMALLLVVIQRAGPTFLSLVNYQVPLWAMAFGALLLGETITERAPAALALILSGVAISQFGDRLGRVRVARNNAPQTP